MQNNETKCGINYTIIIPHKNSSNLLLRCLKSIPDREDLEIIIVDDDSNPEIVDFNNFPGQNRQNTKIIFNKNPKGAGHARNLALPHVRGKWLIFADADDFFNPIFNEKLDFYKDTDYDLVVFSANSVDSDTYENSTRAMYLPSHFDLYEKDNTQGEIMLRYYCNAPWCKFIKYEMITKNQIVFDEVIMHNDVHFSSLVGFYSSNFHADRTAIYCVTNRAISISKNKSEDALLARIFAIGLMNKFYQKHNIPINIDNRHLYQLTIFFLKNKTGYKRGKKILLDMGYKAFFLYFSMCKIILNIILNKVFFFKIVKR